MERFGRILGVDVGGKRVGLARTDLLRTAAAPVGTFSPEDSFQEIGRQIRDEGPVIAIVVGWPLTPQGDPTTATGLVTEYIKGLKKRFPGMEVSKMDERYSSRIAMDIMKEAGIPKRKRHKKGRLDQAAAALILQEFIESRPEL